MSTLGSHVTRTMKPRSRDESIDGFLKFLVGVLLFAFVFGIAIVNSYSVFSTINRFTGIAVIVVSLFLIKGNFRVPLEGLLFGLFILWAIVSGVIVSISLDLYWNYAKLLLQLFPFFLVVINLGMVYKSANLNFGILLIVAAISLVNALVSGESYGILAGASYERVSSFMKNPNSFGALMDWGIVAALFFWGRAKGFRRVFLAGGVALFTIGTVLSGSRKGFIALLVLIFFWLLFTYWRQIRRQPAFILLIAFTLIGIWVFTNFVINNTYLGLRMAVIWNDPVEGDIRLNFYKEAWDIFLAHPFAGVGLNHFQEYSSTGMYAHSDFAEILADTGLFGILFYFPMYIVLWLRIVRLERRITQPEVVYPLGVFKAAILTILVIGLGQPNFNDIYKMFLIATIIGYVLYLERTLTKSPTANAT